MKKTPGRGQGETEAMVEGMRRGRWERLYVAPIRRRVRLLQSVRAGLAGTDAYDLLKLGHEDLSVTNFLRLNELPH